ncbi:type I-E CRISPR-associated protein Cse1/CasA [bacterium]|nr:type I-E CRISPR-associated protein Cse1/CasA [candidate division CSSED10-310 bacterium]
MREFNLISEPWIPCIDSGGASVEFGIRDVLLNAHELREICDDSPLVTVSIHRVLLAVLYRAYRGPEDFSSWRAMYQRGTFDPAVVDNYLHTWHDRFFLFHERYPFMQVAGLDLNDYKEDGSVKNDKSDGLMRLIKEAPDKGGRILFDHRTYLDQQAYENNQIARMLICAQSFAGTGIASSGRIGVKPIKPTPCQFAPGVDGMLSWLQRFSLAATLMLNLPPQPFNENDLPCWENDNIVSAAIASWNKPPLFTGPVQRFAPLSRFIRIIDNRTMFFTNGLKTAPDTSDPMKTYSRTDLQKPFQAVKLRQEKAAWRDAHALFTIDRPSLNKPPDCMNNAARAEMRGVLPRDELSKTNIVGLVTDKDKVLLWRHERLPVPSALMLREDLRERLGLLLRQAELVASRINNRIHRIARLYLAPECESTEGRQLDKTEVSKIMNAIDPRPVFWSRLENVFYTLLKTLPGDWDEVADDWLPDEAQRATLAWRGCLKKEAQHALGESIHALGTTARAIQAVARVSTEFTDEDLEPEPEIQKKGRKRGEKS